MGETEIVKPSNNSCTGVQSLNVSEVYAALATRPGGLTVAELEERLGNFGRNVIKEVKGTSLIIKFLSNFTHLMAILLWIGGIIGFIAQMPELGVAIWMVNIINGVFSFWQEFRAERATEELKKLLPTSARVIRGGCEMRVLAEELVPGDIVLLEEGDKISADCRLVEVSELSVNQSTLTGESHPVSKTQDAVLRTDLSHLEFSNLIFAGTSVASGTGKAVITATGMNTEFGKIAGLTQNISVDLSPLQKEMARLTKIVSVMAFSIGTFFFIAAVVLAQTDIAESFIFAMGMIVAFVPEGLLPTVTLSLAMGVQRMAKRHALIKRLSSVETLGCTTVICTDKTGTLTQNEMTVSDIWMVERQYSVTGTGYAPAGQIIFGGKPVAAAENSDLNQLLTAASLCNNSRLVPPDTKASQWTILGDPTEAALKVAAGKAGMDLDKLATQNRRLRELPFESRRKRMSTIHLPACQDLNIASVAYVKGAPKEVLDLCTRIRINGQDLPLDDKQRQRIMAANDRYARSGLRVLSFAWRGISKDSSMPANLSGYTVEMVERDLVFLGLIAMADPPRPQVASAVEECRRAGIRIIMITGDYGLTAESIARRIGIIKGDKPRIITGLELEKTTPAELRTALAGEVIFARVAPEQKLQVVSALQDMGHIVAVTGDGVNDAPALKKADIGVAMGMAGTDVAKEAADMILTDDNFASIVSAIEEGRAVYNNIRKFAVYVFNSNMPEAFPFIIYLFSRGAIPLPLTVMQVLAIDLGTDMLPAIGLGSEPPETGIMDLPPRAQNESLLTRKLLLKAFLWYGMIESAIAVAAYFFLNWEFGWPSVPLAASGSLYQMATTMTLAAVVCTQIGVVFCCRTDRASIFKIGFHTNRMVLFGIASELILLSILIYTPFLHQLFNTAPIGLKEWAYLFIGPPLIFLIDELRKLILRRKSQYTDAKLVKLELEAKK